MSADPPSPESLDLTLCGRAKPATTSSKAAVLSAGEAQRPSRARGCIQRNGWLENSPAW